MGEGRGKNIGRLGRGTMIESRVMETGRLLKERDGGTECEGQRETDRETHFTFSFPSLCVVVIKACPCCTSSVPPHTGFSQS